MICHRSLMRIVPLAALAGALGLAACATSMAASRNAARPAKPAASATATPETVALAATPAPKKFPVTIKAKGGAVEAHFDGEAPPADMKAPLRFGTSRLWFSFAGDKTAHEFKPSGNLEFSDWFFDVFSPDGKWVLLPQDHYGPYHVVAVSHLKAYLDGKAKPDKVLQDKSGGPMQALVHFDAHWVGNDEVEYKAGGETAKTNRVKVD